MNHADRETVRAVVNRLTAACEYHGEKLERTVGFNGAPGPCCDTGAPALERRRALAVLDAEADAQKASA